ncbi:hypothetical protein [Micromonospora globispora]|uniref:hypothetical protein n=1 Tax=Micromonospora globispora TaxID=1450148 RepID=UPI000F602BBF|nr:hypothetical protein [Micromonospora globispora]RQW99444.1 hypothetical protein DKL51_08520 [Micromonospora globispora]
MNSADEQVSFTPQAYPLWIAWFDPTQLDRQHRSDLEAMADMTDDELDMLVRDTSPPHLVVAWEHIPDSVPQPVVPEIGRDSGTAFLGLTKEEVFEQVRFAAQQDRNSIRRFLKRNPRQS